MATQTISILASADDGYEAPAWTTSAPAYLQSPTLYSGWSFVVVTQIPAGSTISKCFFKCYRLTAYSGTWYQKLQLENVDPATNSKWSSGHVPTSGALLTGDTTEQIPLTFQPVSYQSQYVFGEGSDHELILAADMQSLVDSYGTINVGDIINVAGIGNGGSGGYAEIEEGAGTNPAQLYIEWTAPVGGTAALSGSAVTPNAGTAPPGISVDI